jgi:hypothetical protein
MIFADAMTMAVLPGLPVFVSFSAMRQKKPGIRNL